MRRKLRIAMLSVLQFTMHHWSRALAGADAFASYIAAKMVVSKNRIISRSDGHVSLSSARRLAIFCHYDPAGEIKAPVREYVGELFSAGWPVIFVSSSPALEQSDVEQIEPFCVRVVHRENTGYDFGCWRDGLNEAGDYRTLESMLLVNDSVLGPFSPLEGLLARCDDTADVWGLTDNLDFTRHLQSYFLLFRPNALQSRAFQKFWREFVFANSKNWIIRACEVGFSRRLRKAGLRLAALYPIETVRSRALEVFAADDPRVPLVRQHRSINSTHYMWDVLLTEFGFPFVKRELVEKNPQGIANVTEWRSIVAAAYGDAALKRVMGEAKVQAGVP